MSYLREIHGDKPKFQKRKKKYYEPKNPDLAKPPLLNSTRYLCLTNEDLVYSGNMHRLKTMEFQFILKKTVEDLNILLHFTDQQFWKELRSSKSLRQCLESCIQAFPRRSFGLYSSQLSSKDTSLQKDEYFQYWSHLVKIVLLIYYRIVCSGGAEEQEWIYENWVIDIPKMLYLMEIYGETSPLIVKKLITTIFTKMQHYNNDLDTFLDLLGTFGMDALEANSIFEYKSSIIHSCTNFNNPFASFTCSLVKCIFQTMDYYNNLINLITFFPEFQVYKIVTSQHLLMNLIHFYFQFNSNIEGRWEIEPQLFTLLNHKIQKTRQLMAKTICLFHQKLLGLLEKDIDHHIQNDGYAAYIGICRSFANRKNASKQSWQRLIGILILENPQTSIFIINKFILKMTNKQQINELKACQLFEAQFRAQQHHGFSNLQLIQLKLNQIPQFNDWKMFRDSSSAQILGEQSLLSFDLSRNFTEASALEGVITNHNRFKIKQQQPSTTNILSQICPQMGPHYACKRNEKEYDDEPDDDVMPPLIGIGFEEFIHNDEQDKRNPHYRQLDSHQMSYQQKQSEEFLNQQTYMSYPEQMDTGFVESQHSQDQDPCTNDDILAQLHNQDNVNPLSFIINCNSEFQQAEFSCIDLKRDSLNNQNINNHITHENYQNTNHSNMSSSFSYILNPQTNDSYYQASNSDTRIQSKSVNQSMQSCISDSFCVEQSVEESKQQSDHPPNSKQSYLSNKNIKVGGNGNSMRPNQKLDEIKPETR